MVLDVSDSKGSAFRLAAVYAPTRTGRLVFFRRLETFLGTACSLREVEGSNGILNGKIELCRVNT